MNWYGNKRLRNTFYGMLQRCHNVGYSKYKDYGARGISVCDEWRQSPEAFRDWALANGYDNRLTGLENSIDRVDFNGPYSPANCRWIHMADQGANRRKPTYTAESAARRRRTKPQLYWDAFGEHKPAMEFCKQYGKSYSIVTGRMRNHGVTIEQALTLPEVPREHRRHAREFWELD